MLLPLLLACSFDNDRGDDPEALAQAEVKTFVAGELGAVADAALALQAAAPTPDADGWGPGETAAMEAAWVDVRVGYEHVEGAIAVLFPDLDHSSDQRYEAFIATGPDEDAFDGEIVTGNHAIERIVWTGRHPEEVVAFESGLPYYAPAAFPADEAEATTFRDGLCQRFVDDTAAMDEQFAPLTLDSAAAFRGVIASMAEQYEKVSLAATGEDESRYAGHTLADMRANLDGGAAIYAAFQPWLVGVEGGEALDTAITEGFARVDAAYAAVDGNAIPPVPEDWNPDAPSAEDLDTPYGRLWSTLSTEADPTQDGALVASMMSAADALGIPQL